MAQQHPLINIFMYELMKLPYRQRYTKVFSISGFVYCCMTHKFGKFATR